MMYLNLTMTGNMILSARRISHELGLNKGCLAQKPHTANHRHPLAWMSDKTQLIIRKTLFYKVAYTIDIWLIETSYDGVHS